MKIIFLDIDGVLNSREYDRRRDWKEMTAIDETRLPLLKRIVDETGAKIVLSSTWRSHWSAHAALCDEDGTYINRTFAKYGLEIIDKTPDLGITAERRDEIALWLKRNGGNVEKFAIIDDCRFGWGNLSPYFIKTNPVRGPGLEEEHVSAAIELLNS